MKTPTAITVLASLAVAGSAAFYLSSASVPSFFGESNQPPVCVLDHDLFVICGGETTEVLLDASASFDPDGGELTFQWASCPDSTLMRRNSSIAMLVIDTSSSCDKVCGVRLRITDDEGSITACRVIVQVSAGTEGCSHGYWKNHTDEWPSGFATTDDFDTTFGVDAFDPDISLLEALELGGGGVENLARQGVAALFDALHPDVDFPLPAQAVIQMVQDAIEDGNEGEVALELDKLVNLGCPL